MKQILKQISLILILTAINPTPVMADYGKDQSKITWFSTSTSGLANRSSMEMATNHIRRGIRLAHKALEDKLSLSDQLIANHNLCIGYLVLQKSLQATPFCARTFNLTQKPLGITKNRGAYHVSEISMNNESHTALSLIQVVLSNIVQQDAQMQFSLHLN